MVAAPDSEYDETVLGLVSIPWGQFSCLSHGGGYDAAPFIEEVPLGLLVDGVWHDTWYETRETGGSFVRPDTQFRNQVGTDKRFFAESGRYHLYVSLACPWAHRTLIYRCLLGLEEAVSVSVVHPIMGSEGWTFDPPHEDPLHGFRRLYEVYLAADKNYSGRVTVPILWDRHTGTIVNNESAEIIRMFDTVFRPLGRHSPSELCPATLETSIDTINEQVYAGINNGVYRAGFATTQAAYEEAVDTLFATMDNLEERLVDKDYLVGDVLTEADIRLFVTMIRFDPVYFGHFKCNRKRLIDYPNLLAHTRMIYALPGIAETCNLEHIKQHYYASHPTINPSGVVPVGPDRWL